VICTISTSGSFRDAAGYALSAGLGDTRETVREQLIHDRVGFIHTENMPIRVDREPEKAHAAWRKMAFTAMNQDLLKQQHGIPLSGRKTKDTVVRLSLSWHPDDRNEITRDMMIDAAQGALKSLGMNSNEALIVEHTNTKHKHLHIVASRIAPDGRAVDLFKSQKKLSAWALEYQNSLNQILGKEVRDRLNDTPRRLERSEVLKSARGEVRAAFQHSDDVRSFQNALSDRGYVLARSENPRFKRTYVVAENGAAMLATHAMGLQTVDEKAKYYERFENFNVASLPTIKGVRLGRGQPMDDRSLRRTQQVASEAWEKSKKSNQVVDFKQGLEEKGYELTRMNQHTKSHLQKKKSKSDLMGIKSHFCVLLPKL